MKFSGNSRIFRLTFSALMIALSTVLSMLKLFELPQGGSVTVLSMLPLVIVAQLYGTRWGLFTCLAHAMLQLLLGVGDLRGLGLVTLVGAVILDYLLAFTVIGFSGLTRRMKNKAAAAGIGALIGLTLRFICHFLSGWLLWSEVIASWGAVTFSLSYNGSYMLPEIIFTAIASAITMPLLNKAFGLSEA